MKKITTISIAVLLLSGCSAKNKAYSGFKKQCEADIKYRYTNEADYKANAENLCDCFARKASIKYKTVEEGMVNKQDLQNLIALCELQLKNKQ